MSVVKVIVTGEEIGVPDTGSFVSGGIDQFGGLGIGIVLSVVAIGAIVVTTTIIKKRVHNSSFVGTCNSSGKLSIAHRKKKGGFKLGSKSKKITGLFVILLLSSALFIPLTMGGKKMESVFADEGDTELAITAGDTTINVELNDDGSAKSVYAGQSITVNSSTVNGYTLSMYASSADLLPASSDNQSTIAGLTKNTPIMLAEDSWGVSLSNPINDGKIAVWYAVPTTEASALVIRDVSSTTPASDRTEIYYGVRLTGATNIDTYSTNVTYMATAKVSTDAYYMQDMTLSQCQKNVGTNGNADGIGDSIIVHDKRSLNYPDGDDGDYTVRYINGQCWMTQNLRITGVVSAENSNFTGSGFNVSAFDLKTDGGNQCNDTNGYNYACSHVPDNADLDKIGATFTAKDIGVWYNYFAASASTVGGDNDAVFASSDICPSGWRLPKSVENGLSDWEKLAGIKFSSDNGSLTDGLLAFNLMNGGEYQNGSLGFTRYSHWWSASGQSVTARDGFIYDATSGNFGALISLTSLGQFIRCVMDSN